MSENTKFKHWGILELLDHQILGGLISEIDIGNSTFIQISVPEIPERSGCIRIFGIGAIRSINIFDLNYVLEWNKAYLSTQVGCYGSWIIMPNS